MKKTKILFLLPFAAAALAGCNNGDKNQCESATVSFDKTTLSLFVEETGNISAKMSVDGCALPEGTWSSDHPEIASVDQTGKVTAVAVGTATISFGNLTCTVTVSARGISDLYALTGVLKNSNLKDFETNVLDAQDQFRGETSPVIEVGDDNPFVMKPTLKIIDKATFSPVSESIWNYDYEFKLQEYVGKAYVDTTTNYGAFDAKKCEFDFNEDAIGKQFKLSVMPGGLTAAQKANPEYSTVVEVKVSNGYNVYNANELAYFNDVAMSDYYRQEGNEGVDFNGAWKTFRQSKGLNVDYVAPSIFLQSDIQIKKENLPDVMFWASDEEAGVPGAAGKMRDGTDVYIRYATGFSFNGNYFNVDTQLLPVCGNCNKPKDNISHATLFKIVQYEVPEGTDISLNFKNCSYFGNGPRTDEDDSRRLGLIFFKVHNHRYNGDNGSKYVPVKATFDNFNVLRAVMGFYTEYGPVTITVKDSKLSECYANGIFLYENGDLEVVNSELSNVGGPIIVTSGTDNTDVGFHIHVDTASKLENWVAGSEPWFVNTGAAAAIPQFKSADAFLNSVGKTMLKTEQELMNTILINYGECPYVQFSVGDDTPFGIDKKSPNVAQYMQDVYVNGYTKFFSENGGEFTLNGDTPVGGNPAPFAAANIFDIAKFNSLFGFVSFICEIMDAPQA